MDVCARSGCAEGDGDQEGELVARKASAPWRYLHGAVAIASPSNRGGMSQSGALHPDTG